MEDKDGDGEPDCGLMEKVKKSKNPERVSFHKNYKQKIELYR